MQQQQSCMIFSLSPVKFHTKAGIYRTSASLTHKLCVRSFYGLMITTKLSWDIIFLFSSLLTLYLATCSASFSPSISKINTFIKDIVVSFSKIQ